MIMVMIPDTMIPVFYQFNLLGTQWVGTCKYFRVLAGTLTLVVIPAMIPVLYQFLFLCIETVKLGTLSLGTWKYFRVLAGTFTVDFRYCWVLLKGI